jgi:energy-coupling factor transport system permease protein
MLVTWQYKKRNSLMEKIDPRARWIFSLLMLFSITLFWDLRFLLFFFILAFAWYATARVPFADTRKAWTLVTFLLFMTISINTIITGGGASGVVPPGTPPFWTISFQWPILNLPFHFVLTSGRAVFAVAQVLRIFAISALFVIIPYSTDPRLYGITFRGLGLPDRVAFSMDLAFRYVPTLARDFQMTLDAQRARGYEIERVRGGIFEQVRKIAPLIVPVTMNSILSGEDVTNAMDLRCFGTHPRTWVENLRYRPLDFVVIGVGASIFITSLVLRFGLHLGGFWMPF